MKRSADLRKPHDLMLARFGPQHWWPGDSPFEIMLGAILTQNTAWANVEKAIANLRQAGLLSCRAILALPDGDLAGLIRPAGYFNVKSLRLKALCRFIEQSGHAGDPARLGRIGTMDQVRRALLAVNGVGEETADAILLYALGLPVFVVDAYTRRIFTRLGLLHGNETYSGIKSFFEAGLTRDTRLYNEYHALIVRLGKDYCRPRPRCAGCPLQPICPRIGLAPCPT